MTSDAARVRAALSLLLDHDEQVLYATSASFKFTVDNLLVGVLPLLLKGAAMEAAKQDKQMQERLELIKMGHPSTILRPEQFG